MEDLQTRLENLRLEADDCELIARLSADLKRRAFFAKLSVQFRASARDVEQAIKSRIAAEDAGARCSKLAGPGLADKMPKADGGGEKELG